MSTEHRDLAKVLFRIPEGDGGVRVETLWASPLGDDLYELDNSPFDAYSVSWKDVVYAPFDPDEEMAAFQRVKTKSGHRTVRVILDPPADPGNPSQTILDELVALGCSYEGASKHLFSIDIPPHSSFENVRQYLIERELQFEHADPTYEELFPDES